MAAHPELVFRWIDTESPITNPQQDMFGHASIARRVARTLLAGGNHTAAVIGPYGCGKSSIINLIKYYLDNPDELHLGARPEYVFDQSQAILRCTVGGWGLREEAVAEMILSCIVREIGKAADCIHISRLPSQYSSALSGSQLGNLLATIVSCGHDAVGLLERLDWVLTAIGARLIVFLEDLDRIASPNVNMQLAALLDRLKGLRRVGFVLAVGPRGIEV